MQADGVRTGSGMIGRRSVSMMVTGVTYLRNFSC
jgi:hypothetical protein